jgi:autotransporter-associated beta strand protein
MKLFRVGSVVLMAGVLAAATHVAHAADWVGGNGYWSSDLIPGWNGAGVPNSFGAVANHGVSTTSLTVQDIPGLTVGTISLTNNSNNGWMILNNGGISFSNGGTSVISNTNTGGTSQGALEIAGGFIYLTDTLMITNASSGSTISNGAIQLGTLITGSGNLVLDNANNTLPTSTTNYPGAIRIQGTNDFIGNTLIQRGLTTFNLAGSFGPSASNSITIGAAGMGHATLLSTASVTMPNSITFESGSGGALTLGSMTTSTYSGTHTVNGDATYYSGTPGAAVTTVTVSGAIQGSGGINKTGPGIVSITGTTNSYAGNTVINEGQLRFAAPGSIGGSGASVLVGNGAVFSYGSTGNAISQAILDRINPASTGTVALNLASADSLDMNAAGLNNVSLASTAAVTYSGTLTPAASTYRFGGGTSTLTVSSALTGAGNSVVMNGATDNATDIIVLSNAANTYGGGTTVNSGQLRFTVPGAIGGAGANVTVNSGGIVSYGSTGNVMNQAFLGRINPTSTGVIALNVASSSDLDFAAAGLNNVSLGATATST